MEDQPTTPSGLNPSPPLRRSHRMPVGKSRRQAAYDADVDNSGDPEAIFAEGERPESEVSEVATVDTETHSTATESVDSGAATENPEDDADSEGADAADNPSDDETVTDPETLMPAALSERKPVGRRLKVAVVASAVLFVAAAGFAGATAQPYLADRALVAIKLDVARTAASAITTLWTYTPEDMGALPDRASQFLAGDFEDAYRQYVDGIAATNKQAQVSNDTQVLGTAVESIGPAEATAIVYTNSTATSPLTKGVPSLRYISYRLTMERRAAKWLVSRMSTITTLDLTPQL